MKRILGIALFAFCFSSPGMAINLDQYGGLTGAPSPNGATGYFRLERTSTGQWAVVDPLGNYFWMLAVDSVDNLDGGPVYIAAAWKKYGPGARTFPWVTFVSQAALRLQSWGFNTLGTFAAAYALPIPSSAASFNPVPMPFVHLIRPSFYSLYPDVAVKNVQFGTDPVTFPIRDRWFPDVWDKKFAAEAKYLAQGGDLQLTSLAQCPWLVGTVIDNADDIFGFRTSDAPNIAWVIAATSPLQSYFPKFGVVYSDPTVYAKTTWQAFLTNKYSSVAALDAAWGANYTTFGSTGNNWTTYAKSAPDGVKTNFTFVSSPLPVNPYSVRIFVNGTAVGGDDGAGNLFGQGVSGTMNYATGQASVSFASAPAAGSIVLARLRAKGWPKRITGATGLMDEDGSSPWIGADYVGLTNASPGAAADMQQFVAVVANRYFGTIATAIHSVDPNHLIFGPEALSGTTPSAVLQAAGKYLDVVEVAVRPDGTDQFSLTPSLQWVFQQTGRPITCYILYTSQADSPLSAYPRPLPTDFPTQRARGQAYATALNTMINFQQSGAYPVVGMAFWEWVDKAVARNHLQSGLVTYTGDNAYDGVESQIATGVDQWGYPVGGEKANYGDIISTAVAANTTVVKSFCAALGFSCD